MALPIPAIISAQTAGSERTKFALDGTSFTFLVAEWPTVLPPDPPDIVDDVANTDRYEQGDYKNITHILYRIIEKDDDDDLDDDDRNAVLVDISQYDNPMSWEPYSGTIRYTDRVFELVDADRAAGRHVATMPPVVVDAKTKCYWVTAWLGVDDNDILRGYDLTRP